MTEHYVPRTKYELVKWFKKNKPNYKISGFSKQKLYAIYFGVRRMQEHERLKDMKDSTAYRMLVDIG